jgi:hypothetical protein
LKSAWAASRQTCNELEPQHIKDEQKIRTLALKAEKQQEEDRQKIAALELEVNKLRQIEKIVKGNGRKSGAA